MTDRDADALLNMIQRHLSWHERLTWALVGALALLAGAQVLPVLSVVL